MKNTYLQRIFGGEKINGKIIIDPDNTMKARQFYAAFWGNSLSGNIERYDGIIGHYRGDTIISFKTVAGCIIRLLGVYKGNFKMPGANDPCAHEKRLNIITSAEDLDEGIKNQFKEFYVINHTPANFMPLVWCENDAGNLNLAKGRPSSPYHDFPDLFFRDIKNRYENVSGGGDIIFKNAINREYFGKFQDWKAYVEENYLQDFFKDAKYEQFIQLAPRGVELPYEKSILKSLSVSGRAECVAQIKAFLTNAIDIIEKRAKRLAAVK